MSEGKKRKHESHEEERESLEEKKCAIFQPTDVEKNTVTVLHLTVPSEEDKFTTTVVSMVEEDGENDMEEDGEDFIEATNSLPLKELDTNLWKNFSTTKKEDEKILTGTYNPWLSVLQFGKKETDEYFDRIEYHKQSFDCRPSIKSDDINGENINIKPLTLLEKVILGDDKNTSFFWIRAFKLSVNFELDEMASIGNLGYKNNIIEHCANICFVFHSFLYMMMNFYFNIEANDKDYNTKSPKQGEKLVFIFLALLKQDSDVLDKSFMKKYKKLFSDPTSYSLQDSQTTESYFYSDTFLDEYFDIDIVVDIRDNDNIITVIKKKVDKLWDIIENTWEQSLMENYGEIGTNKKKWKGRHWEKLFSKYLSIDSVSNGFYKRLKLLNNELLLKIVNTGGGGSDAADISIIYRAPVQFKKEDNSTGNEAIGRYCKLMVSIKNMQDGGVRLGKEISSKLYILWMGLPMIVLEYIKKNSGSTPVIQKLSYLLDCKANSLNSVYDSVRCGELAYNNMIIFDFMMRELFIHFYTEFTTFDAMFKIVLTEEKHYYDALDMSKECKKYLKSGGFNFWRVYEIATQIKRLKNKEDIQEILKSYGNRKIAGIIDTNKKLKEAVSKSILENMLTDTDVMRILSYLTNRIPIEVDKSLMTEQYLANQNNYHLHTVSLSQILKILVLGECYGDRRKTNKTNTMLLVVTEEEILGVSTEYEDYMMSYIWTTGQLKKGLPLNSSEMTTWNNKSIGQRTFLTSSDRLKVSVTQLSPKALLVGIPISKTEAKTMEEMHGLGDDKHVDNSNNLAYNKYNRSMVRFLADYNIMGHHAKISDCAQEVATITTADLNEGNTNEGSSQLELPYKSKKIARSASLRIRHVAGIDKPNNIYEYYNNNHDGKEANNANFISVLLKLSTAIAVDDKERTTVFKALKQMFNEKIMDGTFLQEFVLKDISQNISAELNKPVDSSKYTSKTQPFVRSASSVQNIYEVDMSGGKKINTGIKKSFNGKMKNIYKIKGSNSYYIIYNKKLISVKQYKKELLLNNSKPSPLKPTKQKQSPSPSPVKPTKKKQSLSPSPVKPTKQKQSPSPSPLKPTKQKQSPSPSPAKPTKQKQSPSPSPPNPLVDKSNISKYNLRIEQYKNKNLSDYFINKLKTHIRDNDDKNNIYKIGIKKIKVILKDIYKNNK